MILETPLYSLLLYEFSAGVPVLCPARRSHCVVRVPRVVASGVEALIITPLPW
ncbi:hypothetical protein GNE06_16220 [Trichormus variabilis 9RC]|nr:hypothetical protein [Trichormus variabilis 9RC]